MLESMKILKDSPAKQVATLGDDEECGGNTVHSHNVAIPAQDEDVNHSLQIIEKELLPGDR